jgi:hypothetical protein
MTVLRCRFPCLVALLGAALAGCAGVVAAPLAARAPVSSTPQRPPDDASAVVETKTIQDDGQPPAAGEAPPTWGTIYARYFGPGTEANCARSHCHAKVMPDADSAYRWLTQRGYIAGEQSALVGDNSCLRWFGGNMPPKGVPNERAARDLTAWAAAGARND